MNTMLWHYNALFWIFLVENSRGSHKWFSRLATRKIASHQLVLKLKSMAAELNLALGQDQIRCRKETPIRASIFGKWKWKFGGPMAKWNEPAFVLNIQYYRTDITDYGQYPVSDVVDMAWTLWTYQARNFDFLSCVKFRASNFCLLLQKMLN